MNSRTLRTSSVVDSSVTGRALTVIQHGQAGIWSEQSKLWDEWCAAAAMPSAFCTADWLETWWETYGSNAEPWVLEVRDESGTAIGYAPLMRQVRTLMAGARMRSIEFIGTGERVCPEYLDVVAAPGQADLVRWAVCRWLAQNRPAWDRLLLAESWAQDSLAAVAAAHHWPRCSVRRVAGSLCPYMHLPSSWDELLAGQSRHMRRTVRQISHRIERELKVTWRVFSLGDDPTQAVRVMTDLHTRSRQRWGESGNFVDEQYRRFHTAMVARAATAGRLFLAFLGLDGRPAVFVYGFLFGGRFFHYQTGYDPVFARYRPGWYAVARTAQELIERGHVAIDFLRGEHDYKWHWAENWNETSTTMVFSHNMAGTLGRMVSDLRRRFRRSHNAEGAPPEFVRKKKMKEAEPGRDEAHDE